MMKPKQYLPPSILTALSETQKAMNQRLTIIGETFGPSKNDEQGSVLRHQRKGQSEAGVQQEHPVFDAGAEQRESSDAVPSPSLPVAPPQQESVLPENELQKDVPSVNPSNKALKSIGKLNAAELRRAVILSEIIGPPLSRRGR